MSEKDAGRTANQAAESARKKRQRHLRFERLKQAKKALAHRDEQLYAYYAEQGLEYGFEQQLEDSYLMRMGIQPPGYDESMFIDEESLRKKKPKKRHKKKAQGRGSKGGFGRQGSVKSKG